VLFFVLWWPVRWIETDLSISPREIENLVRFLVRSCGGAILHKECFFRSVVTRTVNRNRSLNLAARDWESRSIPVLYVAVELYCIKSAFFVLWWPVRWIETNLSISPREIENLVRFPFFM